MWKWCQNQNRRKGKREPLFSQGDAIISSAHSCCAVVLVPSVIFPSFTIVYVLLIMGGKSSRTKERTNQYTYETQTDRLTGQIFGAFTSSFVHQKERSSSKRWSQKIGGWMRQALNGKPMLQPPPPPPQSRLLENRPAQEQTTSPPPPHTIYPVRYHLGRENNPLHQPVGASTPSKQPPLRPIDLRLIQGI